MSFKIVLKVPQNSRYFLSRSFSVGTQHATVDRTLLPDFTTAWQVRGYNGIDGLELTENVDIPPLKNSCDVLVEVNASSINKLDVWMCEGYGHAIFEKYHKLKSCITSDLKPHFPFVPGRDFSGIVRAIGGTVKNLKVGMEVMGVVPPSADGSHAKFVVASARNVFPKPKEKSFEEAAAIPYTGLTAWSALRTTGELCFGARNKQILILGASGGVGSLAVQLSKIWGAAVAATCPTDSVDCVQSLGADVVIDYTSPEADMQLRQFGGFDVVLDCTGRTERFPLDLLKTWSNAKYVTLSPPTLKNFDQFGVVGGVLKNGLDLFSANSSAITQGKSLRWAFFTPNSCALKEMVEYFRTDRLRAIIDSVYSYEQLREAYTKMEGGSTRGKIIVTM